MASPFINLELAQFLTQAASLGVQNAQRQRELDMRKQEADARAKEREQLIDLREKNFELAQQKAQVEAEIKKAREERQTAEFELRKADTLSKITARTDRYNQNGQRMELLRQSAAARTATLQQKAIAGELETRLRTDKREEYQNPLYLGFSYEELQKFYNTLIQQRAQTLNLTPEAEQSLINQLSDVEQALGVKTTIIEDFQSKLDPARQQIFSSLFTPSPAPAAPPLETGGAPASMIAPATNLPTELRPALETSVERDFDIFTSMVRQTLGDPNSDRTQLTETILNTLLDPKVRRQTKTQIGALLREVDPTYLRQITEAMTNARRTAR